MEVQRTWSHLESIFTESEDIRRQLPEDCERFDRINVDFKVIFFQYQLCVLLFWHWLRMVHILIRFELKKNHFSFIAN